MGHCAAYNNKDNITQNAQTVLCTSTKHVTEQTQDNNLTARQITSRVSAHYVTSTTKCHKKKQKQDKYARKHTTKNKMQQRATKHNNSGSNEQKHDKNTTQHNNTQQYGRKEQKHDQNTTQHSKVNNTQQ
jgi:hypothetical protein